jgi:hypothetical protein
MSNPLAEKLRRWIMRANQPGEITAALPIAFSRELWFITGAKLKFYDHKN